METTIDVTEKKRFKIKDLLKKIQSFFNDVFSSNRKTILFLAILLSTLMGIYFAYIYFVNHNFYNNWSDDSLQYYPIMCDFIADIKSGNFSFYSFQNYLGASFFSDVYYVPLDGFTCLILLLSLMMNTEVAMSIVEIVKLISGAVAIATYLAVKGVKPKATLLIGLFYFSSSGITCYSCFPSFTSLAFYLPFSLIIGHYFLKGKWYLVPIYAMTVVFYNFYLAYTVFAFMCFSMLALIILNKRGWLRGIWELIKYVLLILLGLCMAMCMFLPSMLYILNCTTRDVNQSGLAGLILMFKSYIDTFLTLVECILRLFKNIATSTKGIFGSRYIFSDSFIQLRHVYESLLSSRTIDGVRVNASYFNVEEYFRMAITTFTPLTPSSFYGYQNSYFLEHISFYITSMGLLFSTYIWFLHDYKSNVYKGVIIVTVIMLLLPFFSYIYSANLSVLYTRWFNVVSIPLLVIDGHVLTVAGDQYNLKPKKLAAGFLGLSYIAIIGSYHTLCKTRELAESNEWNEVVVNFEDKLFYLVTLALFVVCVLLIGLYLVSKISKKKIKITSYVIVSVIGAGILALIGTTLLTRFQSISEDEWVTSVKESILYGVEDQMEYQYIVFAILTLMALGMFAICSKYKKMFWILVSIECIISACMSFGVSVIYKGRETTFQNTHDISDFLEEYIDEPDVYRIYVDSSISDIMGTNTARLLPTGCNQEIFHSFIYKETDDVAGLIYGKSDEGQASKRALNTYSYYLNVFLGYKYVVATPESSFASYDPNQFDLVAESDKFILLKFKDYEEFLVYDSYTSTDQFDKVKSSLKDVSRIRLMLKEVVIDSDYLETLEKYFGDATDISDYEDITTSNTYSQRKVLATENKSIVEIDGVYYYRYAFEGEDAVTTRSYAINLFGFDSNSQTLIDNNQIYFEYANGETKYLTSSNMMSMNGSTFHFPVYGSSSTDGYRVKYLFVYAGEEKPITIPALRYSMEAIVPSAKALASYEAGEDLPDGESLQAAIKFEINGEIDSGVISVTLTKNSSSTTLSFSTMYIEYMDGEIVSAAAEVSIEKPIRSIYIVKSTDVYNQSNPPQIKILSYAIENAYSDTLSDKDVSVSGSKMTISYTNDSTSDGYKLIVIPTAYSEEWKVLSGNVVDTVSANGGFLGIIVPSDVDSNTIVLEFVPDGWELGLTVSILSILFFISILSFYFEVKKHKEGLKCQL